MTVPTRTDGALGRALVLSGAFILATCTSSPDDLWYHARVQTADGREIPFFLNLPRDCGEGAATIVNGRERIPVPCRRIQEHLRLDFPVWSTLIEADENDAGDLAGNWCRDLPGERACMLAFHARPVRAPEPLSRFGPIETAESSVSGEWRFEFRTRGLARGVFEQLPSGEVNGSVDVPSEYGDLRFLAGVATGERILLSTFDGQHALLLEGRIDGDGNLSGDLLDFEHSDAFVARRFDAVALPDPRERVTPKDKAALPFLADSRYQGKPVIVEIFGTWCPNCNDLAPVLARIHRENRERGLEVLSLAYEAVEDSEYVERRFREYQRKHGIESEIRFAGTLDDLAEGEPSWLSGVEGVPVLVFVDRSGAVRGTYAGFSGPATGEAHVQAVADIERLANQILEEP